MTSLGIEIGHQDQMAELMHSTKKLVDSMMLTKPVGAMMPLADLHLDFEPVCRGEMELTKDFMQKENKHSEIILKVPFPVVRRKGGFWVIGREHPFIAAKELGIKEVPIILIEDEREYRRQMISSLVGPQEHVYDVARRVRDYQLRWELDQRTLGEEFGCSQPKISRYLKIESNLYGETVEVLLESLRVHDTYRTESKKPTRKLGADHMGFERLSLISRIHPSTSSLTEEDARVLQKIEMTIQTTKPTSIKILRKKIELLCRRPRQHIDPNPVANVIVYGADSRFLLSVVPPGSIDMVMTSPPYCRSQGYEEQDQSYVEHLENIIVPLQAAGVALRPGGTAIVNIDDWRREGVYFPYRDLLVWAMREVGLNFLTPGIWMKSWQERYIPNNERRLHTQYETIQNWEYLLMFRKKGSRTINSEQSDRAKMAIRDDDEINEYGTRFRAVQQFPTYKDVDTEGQVGKAGFPNAIPDWFVRAYSFEGDTVLDPFYGQGTALSAAAQKHNRSVIGFEVNPAQLSVLGDIVSPIQVATIEPELPSGWRKVLQAILENIPLGQGMLASNRGVRHVS